MPASSPSPSRPTAGCPPGDARRGDPDGGRATGAAPAYYMVNCAHPDARRHDADRRRGPWTQRVARAAGQRLDGEPRRAGRRESLDAGDTEDLGARYAALREQLPQLTVLGGCCGTDARHIDAIRRHCTGRVAGTQS